MDILTADIIRYIASFGVDVARLMCLSSKVWWKGLRREIYTLYGHLPVSRGEVVEYVIHLVGEVEKKLKANRKSKKAKKAKPGKTYLEYVTPEGFYRMLLWINVLPGPSFPIEVVICSWEGFRHKRLRRVYSSPILAEHMVMIEEDVNKAFSDVESFHKLQWPLDLTKWVYQQRGKRCTSIDPTFGLKMCIKDLSNFIIGMRDFEKLGCTFRALIKPTSNDKYPIFEHIKALRDKHPKIIHRISSGINDLFSPSIKRKVKTRLSKHIPKAELELFSHSLEFELTVLHYFVLFSLEEL